jgi:peptidyl-prolyl cis-trans isomerase B (cyclophilin B)
MNSFLSRIQYSLCWSICLCAVCVVGGWAQESNSGKAKSAKRRLTPEERKEKELAKQQIETEAQKQRWATYGVIPDDDHSPLADAYRTAVQNFRTATAEFTEAQARLQLRLENTDASGLSTRWIEKLMKNQSMLFALRNAAADLVFSDPIQYENVGLMLRDMMLNELANDRVDHWAHAARAVLRCEKIVDDEVILKAGYAGYIDCDWELATSSWAKLQAQGKLPQTEQILLSKLPEVKANWEAELELRKQDEGKNNPRVEIVTSKGIIEVELFEDDAPETVRSFVYLVENGYYNRLPFFLVRSRLLAQTGCEKGDGKGTAGFTIRYEGDGPTARRHFRGSLAFPLGIDAETQKVNPDSGGSQFYFAFAPLPFLDGHHTVFGRVVKNTEFLGLLKEIDMTDEEKRKNDEFKPDGILSAKVLSKRDHEYRPTPVFGKLPFGKLPR